MPLYEYEDVRTGERIELFRTIANRDRVPAVLKRVLVVGAAPAIGNGLFTGQARDPQCAEAAVPRAFKQLEATMPSDRIARDSGFSVKEIKRAWDFK